MGFTCTRCREYQSNMYKAGWLEKNDVILAVICDDCAEKAGLNSEKDDVVEWKALTVERSAEALIPLIKNLTRENKP